MLLGAQRIDKQHISKFYEMRKDEDLHDKHRITLSMPVISGINNTLLLIETSNFICPHSTVSLTCLDNSINASNLILYSEDSLGLELRQNQGEPNSQSKRAKKSGCSCKKTNCLKMYCQCFSTGKICSPECSCYGCHNHEECQQEIERAKEELKSKNGNSNRHTSRGCNCKKSQCQKKYCECFNAGLECTGSCNCNDCLNMQGQGHAHNISVVEIQEYAQ